MWMSVRHVAAAALGALTAVGLGAWRCEAVPLDLAAEHAIGGGNFSPAGRMSGTLDVEVGTYRLGQQGVITGHEHVRAWAAAGWALTCCVLHTRWLRLYQLAQWQTLLLTSPHICCHRQRAAWPGMLLGLAAAMQDCQQIAPLSLGSVCITRFFVYIRLLTQ